MLTKTRQRGFTLVELVLFIVIVGIAVAAIGAQFMQNVQHSAEPLLRQKAIAVANSHMDALQGLPFATISSYSDSTISGFTVDITVSSSSAWSATSHAESIPAADAKKIDVAVAIAATGESLSFTLYRTNH
ncbi:MAG: type II secretion system GspH family protein [Gammaproteobacteria bacterium]|nr:type II secretion system GspH family protein [Gammaproteobacteria bacterium]